MTATDELRRLLDERGVEWRKAPHYSGESQDNETIFEGNGIEWYTNDHMNGRLGLRALRYEVTPEQAIEATLGRGTCHEEIIDHHWRGCCSCGYIWEFMYGIGKCERPHYCPNCGRKVVDEWADRAMA